ncbi:MAG: hypothetical protein F4Y02_05465 [Chloroflexi bacterium]|nr:hypothetical protein [Chloroflexota bacterium]
MTGNDDPCVALAAQLIAAIDELPDGPFWVNDLLTGRYPFPVSLDVGENRTVAITPQIDAMFPGFAQALADSFFESSKPRFRNTEWTRMVKGEFGQVFGQQCRAGVTEDRPEAAVEAVRARLEERISQIQEREYAFGCHLFGDRDGASFGSFSIGPVDFSPRRQWLDRRRRNGSVSQVTASRLERAWNGGNLRKRKPSRDQILESGVTETVSDCEWVCSVSVGPAGEDAGLRKALIGMRLAVATIALAWERPSWVVDEVLIVFDRNPHLQQHMVFYPQGGFRSGSRRAGTRRGLSWVEPDDWQRLLAGRRNVFDCAGEAICYVTGMGGPTKRPKMMSTVFQALHWLHEGCREDDDAMAIVKFCSSMDALACGGAQCGIKALGRARFTIRDEAGFDNLVKEIYGDGRSATVHGRNEELTHDWSGKRHDAERLARELLVSCMIWAEQHRDCDDPRALSQCE